MEDIQHKPHSVVELITEHNDLRLVDLKGTVPGTEYLRNVNRDT